ncbi:hypothetical protein V2G26_005081 [Clonostachys chloroleuca]
MAKVGHDKVEEHMEKVKNRIDDEKIKGDEMKMQLTFPDPKYAETQGTVNDVYWLGAESRGGIKAEQDRLDDDKKLAVSKAKEILKGKGADLEVLSSKSRQHPVFVPGEHTGKHIMHADGTISLQGDPALQRKYTTAQLRPGRLAKYRQAKDQPAVEQQGATEGKKQSQKLKDELDGIKPKKSIIEQLGDI